MKWVLIYITLGFSGSMEATVEGTFEDMNDCFWARDYLAVMAGGDDGSFPESEQAVCIRSTMFDKELQVPKLKPGVDSNSIRG